MAAYHAHMISMGVDPGSRRTGWGVVRQEGSRATLVALGVFKTPAKADLSVRLAHLHREMTALLAAHAPDLVGMETVFHGPSTKSLVTLGQARGALLAAMGEAGASVTELSPSEVKKAVTGRGSAMKEQVSHMVGAMLGPGALEAAAAHGAAGRLDATDALAVALATLHRFQLARQLGG
jgi:crossover junction endodeoxyribonuclease RuvC